MLTTIHQHVVQDVVATASTEHLRRLCHAADAALRALSAKLSVGKLTEQEYLEVAVAVETLVRVEGRATGGGWFFRFRKRSQVLKRYLQNKAPYCCATVH